MAWMWIRLLWPAVLLPALAAGAASVLEVRAADAQSPGVFHAIVLLDRQDGANVFEIAAGPATARVTIVGR